MSSTGEVVRIDINGSFRLALDWGKDPKAETVTKRKNNFGKS